MTTLTHSHSAFPSRVVRASTTSKRITFKGNVTTYYMFLAILVGFQIIATLFQGSTSVHQGYQLAQLQQEQKQLKLEKNQLETSLTQEISLQTVAQSETLQQYQPITSTIAVSIPTTRKTAASY